MPVSAQKISLSMLLKGCLSGLMGSAYCTQYGFSRSWGSPPLRILEISHMADKSSRLSAVLTMGLMELAAMAAKLST
jgi:hypothetical protein